MKKLTAMLLALCMLLAAVPALAEDASGNWYMTLADVTLGYILLNEDGTATVNIASQEDMTGTWTAEGDSVTVTVEGQPLTFAYDGASLKSDLFPLNLGREEGRLPMDVISKMMSGEEYELPEGMTETDMVTIAMNFIAEYTKLMEQTSDTAQDAGETTASAAEPAAPAAEPAAPAAEPAVTILQENFSVVESYSGFRGTYLAKVRNDTAEPLYLTGGTLKLTGADGNAAGEATYLYTCGSRYLEPGETSFISMQADMTENIEVTVEKTIEVKQNYYRTDKTVAAADAVYVQGESEYDSDLMKVTVTNDSDQPLPGLEVVFALEDAEGNLLALSTEALYRHELGANSTINMVTSVDSRIADYLETNGIEPTTVEAYAWVETDD